MDVPNYFIKFKWHFQTFLKRVKYYKFYLLCALAYFFYLLTLPYLVALFVPCLRAIPMQAFSYAECNITLVLDSLVIFSLIGFAGTSLFLFIFRPRREIKPLIFTAIILVFTTIAVYYADLLPLIRQVDRTELYIDTIPS